MPNTAQKNSPVKLLMVIFIITTTSMPIEGLVPRKLDDTTTVPTSPDTGGVKCGSCSPCNDPCPPPPPPPPPPPCPCPPPPPPPCPCPPPPPPPCPCPPPPPPPCTPPPPPPCPPPPPPPCTPLPPHPCCPPPPCSGFIYITRPPGNLYPVDPFFSGGKRSFAVGVLPLIGCGFVVGLLAFW